MIKKLLAALLTVTAISPSLAEDGIIRMGMYDGVEIFVSTKDLDNKSLWYTEYDYASHDARVTVREVKLQCGTHMFSDTVRSVFNADNELMYGNRKGFEEYIEIPAETFEDRVYQDVCED